MIITLVNSESTALPRGTPVALTTDGEAVTATGPDDRVIGLVRDTSIAAGESGRVATAGFVPATDAQWFVITGVSGGLVPGSAYHLGASGGLTASDTSGQLVGVALSAYALSLRIAAADGEQAAAENRAADMSRIERLELITAALVEWIYQTGFDDLPESLIELVEDQTH